MRVQLSIQFFRRFLQSGIAVWASALFSLSCFFSTMAFASGAVSQTTALFPLRQSQLPKIARLSPIAEQASTGFALLSPSKVGISLQTVRQNPWFFDSKVTKMVAPVCGPAADLNTLGCWDLATGELLADIPVPGQLTTVPQFHDGSWYVGTSRGFFIRIEGNGSFLTPSFGIDSQLFHGPDARAVMKSLASTTTSMVERSDSALQNFKARFRGSWQWYATANAEFVGTPQFGFGHVFVLTANQSLNAYDLITGKMSWSVRIAPEAQLRLATTSLVLHEKGILVGTSDGYVLLIDPKNGQLQWRQPISLAAGDRFQAVAANPLALSDGVVASNAESATQKMLWDSRAVEWTYPVGSVTQPEFDEGAIFIAGSDGAVHKLDARSGQLRWRQSLPTTSPFVALTLLKKQDVLVAATANGSLFALRMSNGDNEGAGQASNFGPIVGDFFSGRLDLNEVCLSYRTPGFACWTWTVSGKMDRDAK